MEFVFFNCKEIEKQPPHIQAMLLEGDDVPPKPNYVGVDQNNNEYALDYDNIEVTDSGLFSRFKNQEKPLLPKRWKTYKTAKKIKRDTPQSKKLLEERGILPFKEVKLSEHKRRPLWKHANISSLKYCDFFALMIDSDKNSIAGVAKANIETPETESYYVPKGIPELPDNITYIYISEVDIHPDYRGKHCCKRLLTFLMNSISAIAPSIYTHFSINNVSFTKEGIPACVCYVKSGTENGYDVYYHENGPRIDKMTPELCYKSDERTEFKIPDFYYYVKKKDTKGGKRKNYKKKTRKKKGDQQTNTGPRTKCRTKCRTNRRTK
jgi:hypothetical protein